MSNIAQQAADQSTSVAHPLAKAGTALAAGFGVSSWSDAAALIAFVYTACLLLEWCWNKIGRPFCERRGWIERRRRRKSDVAADAE
jgi:hypothetical protein